MKSLILPWDWYSLTPSAMTSDRIAPDSSPLHFSPHSAPAAAELTQDP